MEPIKLTYSEDLIKCAVRRYWVRQIGVVLPVLTVSMAFFVIYLFVGGSRSWLVGAVATSVALSLGMMITVYVVNLRRSMAKLAAMGELKGTLIAGDEYLRIESGAGASELPWVSIKKIRRYDDFWLVYLDSAAFFTIPTIGLEEEEIRSLGAKLEASGAKVA